MQTGNFLGIYLAKDRATVVCLDVQGSERKLVGCFSVSPEQSEQPTFQTPLSFRMFLVKRGCWPSREKKSPRTMSFSRRILGSNWICRGAPATSLPSSRVRATVMLLETLVSTWAGEKRMRAELPGGASPATRSAVAGGAVAGGAVAGGGAVARRCKRNDTGYRCRRCSRRRVQYGPWPLTPGPRPLTPGPWPLTPGPWPPAPGPWPRPPAPGP